MEVGGDEAAQGRSGDGGDQRGHGEIGERVEVRAFPTAQKQRRPTGTIIAPPKA